MVEGDDGTGRLVNRSALNLHGVGLLRKSPSGQLQTAWMGEVPIAKSASDFRWTALSAADAAKPFWPQQREESPMSASKPAAGHAESPRVARTRSGVRSLDVGEVRLIGWSDDDLPGLTIEPAAPQAQRGILVVAHLGYGFGEPAAAGQESQEARL